MNKQDLIESLKAKRLLCYQKHNDAYKEWKKYDEAYGPGDILTRLAAEKMEAENARIDEINDFIETLDSLEA